MHQKGLRQGEPLSPLLFILAIDPLHRVLKAAVEHDLIAPLSGREVKPRVSLYADDAVIFANPNQHEVQTIMEILTEFGNATRLHINPAKSTTTLIRCEQIDLSEILRSFGGFVADFPIRYLGAPLHYNKLRKEDLQPVVDKIIKRGAGWKGRLLSFGKRLILVQSCVASIPYYLMGVIKFPKWAITLINSQLAHCFWDDYKGHFKYHLANWGVIATKKNIWWPRYN